MIFLCINLASYGQKVALVLSGGGAKGIAHVGVLKTLEENHIPIDYIIGTSMGAIVGGFYVAGYTPEQIEDIVLSSDFQKWINGKSEDIYNYHFFSKSNNPSILNLQLDVDESWSPSLKTSLAPDAVINYKLTEYLAQASQISDNNFDRLFVPFRAIAADIFTQNEVVLKDGLLSEAVRASMAVPFFYPPIRVKNDKLLFDGGIYDNFPVEIARKEFNPDIIIGVNVSTPVFASYPYDKDEKLANQSLLPYILNKSDPSLLSDKDIYIEPDLEGYNVLDFSKASSMLDSGKTATIRKLKEINEKIGKREPLGGLEGKRSLFNSKAVPLKFNSVQFRGFNENQITYLRNMFRLHKSSNLSVEDIRKSYFKLVAEDFFKEIYPKIIFDESDSSYTFELNGKSNRSFKIDAGGYLTTRGFSELFLGVGFNSFSKSFSEHGMYLYTGRFYKSFRYYSRFYMSGSNIFYLEPFLTYNNWDYLDNNDLLTKDRNSNYFVEQNDLRAGLEIGLPLGSKNRLLFEASYINNGDQYSNSNMFASTDILDELKFDGLKSKISFSWNSLNRRLYPSAGKSLNMALTYFWGKERYTPGNTSVFTRKINTDHDWFQLKFHYEQYYSVLPEFSTGWEAESVFSNQSFFANYTGTMLNTPTFNPLNDSRILIIPELRSFNFIAGGLKGIYKPGKRYEVRVEGYFFKPLFELEEMEPQIPGRSSFNSEIYYAGTLNLLYHSPVGPVSLAFNYYDPTINHWGIMFHIGYLLFNNRSLE